MIYLYFGFGLFCLMFFLYRHFVNKNIEIFRHQILMHFVRNDKYSLLMSKSNTFMESCNIQAAQELVNQGFLNAKYDVLSVGVPNDLTITMRGYEYIKKQSINN